MERDGDRLGTGKVVDHLRIFREFNDAREFVRSQKISSETLWKKYAKSGKKPFDIPSNPVNTYKNEWKSAGVIGLGPRRVADQYKVFKDFTNARSFVQSLNLRNGNEWKEYCKSGKKPNDVPANPARRYKKDWKGMGDWLGTGAIASFNKKFKTYTASRDFVRGLGIKSLTQWRRYAKVWK